MADDTDGTFEVEDDFAFLGRTFAEYRRMFDLDVDALAGQRILDCPGGPGSFTATAAELGADPVAVDPAYGPSVDTLGSRCRRSIEDTVTQLREKRDLFVWDYYGDVETRGRFQRAAAERFLADYATQPGRYVAAGLPNLPFADDAFDLTLSGNLLFLYDDRLSEGFHREALAELLRVTAGQLRIFPLASLDRTQSGLVESTIERLNIDGHRARLESVPYEFQPGATEMLVVDAGE